MIVLADMEWVENSGGKVSVSQIACLRVDENWQEREAFFTYVRPTDATFHNWEHVGYTGGSAQAFLDAPRRSAAIGALRDWLQEDDVICWWYRNCTALFHRAFPDCRYREIFLYETLYGYLKEQSGHSGNAYKIAAALGIDPPGQKNDSRSDAEMIRRLLAHLQVPQHLLEDPSAWPVNNDQALNDPQVRFLAELGTGIAHRRSCGKVNKALPLKGFATASAILREGFTRCSCMWTARQAQNRLRNQRMVEKIGNHFLYSPTSPVFHKRTCRLLLCADEIRGHFHYSDCIADGRRPCKVCKPSPRDEILPLDIRPSKPLPRPCKTPKKKTPAAAKSRQLSAEESRAIGRLRQAQQERVSFEKDATLTPQEKKDHYTLTQPGYAFWASGGYRTFHLRNCRKLSGLRNLEGFATFGDARSAGYRPCKYCKPSAQHDVKLSAPIYSRKRTDDTLKTLSQLCIRNGYTCDTAPNQAIIQTPAGIWRVHTGQPPYRLDHINRIKNPNNLEDFHRQPRLFLSLQDVFHYIRRHDEKLLPKTGSEGAL